jgi:hypothetical protein
MKQKINFEKTKTEMKQIINDFIKTQEKLKR